MATERKTERLIRSHFEPYESSGEITIEEQSSENQAIAGLLSRATKRGTGQAVGKPEFIIIPASNKNIVLAVEAKADTSKHRSSGLDRPEGYAVDGALHYSRFLSQGFDVISIAVSGTEAGRLRVSHFLQLKGSAEPKQIFARANALLGVESYLRVVSDERAAQDYGDILRYYKTLNDRLHDYKIKADDRALLVSCILIALRQKRFQDDYRKYGDPTQLIGFLLNSARQDFSDVGDVRGVDKIGVVEESFGFIKTQENLLKPGVLLGLVSEIQEHINDFIKTNKFYDAVSELYVEFLKYSNSDKSLGIVLTPGHIADFAAELVGVNRNSVVLDSCCGTGTFLVSAMRSMIDDAGGDVRKEREIKESQVLGVEFQPHVYALACSNMFIHGDGKSGVLKGDCFDGNNAHWLRDDITAGLLNPPFDDKKDDEFEYLLKTLEYLQPNSLCACVLPMKCALSKPKMVEYRRRLMEQHSVLAVFSMPSDLFHNSGVSVQTSIFLVQAHKPHLDADNVFLAFCDDDGFVKTQNRGRVDLNGKWEQIKTGWLEAYRRRSEKASFSVMKTLRPEDEFCAEAYIETDYSQLSAHYFGRLLKQHVAYRIIEDADGSFRPNADCALDGEMSLDHELLLDLASWESRTYDDVFASIKLGGFPSKPDLIDPQSEEAKTILIGASQNHNGSNNEYVLEAPSYQPGHITVGNGGNTGCGQAFFQAVPFNAKSTASILTLRDTDWHGNPFVSLFLVGLIRLERFRYNFGRGWGLTKMKKSKILVPVKDGEVNYEFMERYMKHLPYSTSLADTVAGTATGTGPNIQA